MTDVATSHNPDQHRYEAHLGDDLAGYAEYEVDGDRVRFTHTVVGEEFGGKGVGSALARYALDDVRTQGERSVVAQCPFIARWIEKHPDYADLLA